MASDNAVKGFPEVGRILACNGNNMVVLGISPSASLEDAEKAFHKSSLLVHPDRLSHEDGPVTLTLFTRAFQVLAAAYSDIRERNTILPTGRKPHLAPQRHGCAGEFSDDSESFSESDSNHR